MSLSGSKCTQQTLRVSAVRLCARGGSSGKGDTPSWSFHLRLLGFLCSLTPRCSNCIRRVGRGPGSWVLKTGDQHLCSGGGTPFLTPSPPLPLLSLSHPRTESQLVVSHSFHFPQKPWFSNTFSCSLPGLVLQQDFWA